MGFPILIGLLLIVLTLMVHAVGTTSWIRRMKKRSFGDQINRTFRSIVSTLISTALFLILLHLAEILLWALAYILVPGIESIGTLSEAMYFSIVTYTTLGYGDITLTDHWRLLSGIEAVNGILLFGWSTAMLFAVVQRIWRDTHSIPEDKP